MQGKEVPQLTRSVPQERRDSQGKQGTVSKDFNNRDWRAAGDWWAGVVAEPSDPGGRFRLPDRPDPDAGWCADDNGQHPLGTYLLLDAEFNVGLSDEDF